MLNNVDRSTLPVLGGFLFSQMNYTSTTVDMMDVRKIAPILAGNGVKMEKLSPDYESFPEKAMLRYGQERGLHLHLDRVRIPAVTRQATPVIMKKKVLEVPSKELPSKETNRSHQDEPTSLVGAIQALNDRNAGVPVG